MARKIDPYKAHGRVLRLLEKFNCISGISGPLENSKGKYEDEVTLNRKPTKAEKKALPKKVGGLKVKYKSGAPWSSESGF